MRDPINLSFQRRRPSRVLAATRNERDHSGETDPGRRMESALAHTIELRKLKVAVEAARSVNADESA